MFNKFIRIFFFIFIIFICFFSFLIKPFAEESSWWVYDHTNFSDKAIISDDKKEYIEFDEEDTNTLNRHIEFSNNNTTLKFTGYNIKPHLDFIYYPNNSNEKQIFELYISKSELANSHTFRGIILFFNTTIKGNYEDNSQKISGYLLFISLNGLQLYEFDNVNAKDMHNNGIFIYDGSVVSSYQINSDLFRLISNGVTKNFSINYLYSTYKIKFETTPTELKAYAKSDINDNNYTDDDLILWNGSETLTLNKKESTGFGIGAQYAFHNCELKTVYEISKVTMPVDINFDEQKTEEKKDCSDEEYANEHPTECATCENETFRDQNKDICTKVECYGKEMRLKDAKLLNAVIKYFKIILQLIYIGVPIILIIYGSIDFIKVMMSADKDNGKEHSKRFVKRCIYAVCLFLLGTLFNFFIDLFGIEYGNCDIPSESKVSYEINNK